MRSIADLQQQVDQAELEAAQAVKEKELRDRLKKARQTIRESRPPSLLDAILDRIAKLLGGH